jgi:predicted permease
MGVLLGVIGPVFALILLGAGAMRARFIDLPALKGMTDFVFYAAMPSLLFRAIGSAPPLRLADVAVSFLAGALLLFALALLIGRRVLKARLAAASVFALNCVFGNTVMLGIPIVDAAYGPAGVANLLAVIAFHSAFLLPLATILIEADTGTGTGRGPLGVLLAALPGMARNPVIMTMVLALSWRLTGWAIPEPVQRFLALLGAAGPPLALFCLGASLPRPSGWSNLKDVALAGMLKLLAMPVLVGVLAHAAGVTGLAFKVAVFASALPTGANAFMLARTFGTMTEASASTVVASTAASVVTLSVLLAWLG